MTFALLILQLSTGICSPHFEGECPISSSLHKWIKIHFLQPRKIFPRRNLNQLAVTPNGDITVGTKTQKAASKRPRCFLLRSSRYCLAVLRWSFPRVATSKMTSLRPSARGPSRNTFSCTRLCLAQISIGKGNSRCWMRMGNPRIVVTMPVHRLRWEQIWSNSSDKRPIDSNRR